MTEIVSEDVKKMGYPKVYLEELLADSNCVFQHSLISINVQQGTPS